MIWPTANWRRRVFLDPCDEGLLPVAASSPPADLWGAATPWLWDLHLARLLDTAGRIGMPLESARLPTPAAVANLLRALDEADAVLRINASAGTATSPGRVWMIARTLPTPQDAYRVQFSDVVISPKDPWAELKTFNYGARLTAGRRAASAGFDDALIFDPDGNLLEASSQLFVGCERWLTPPLPAAFCWRCSGCERGSCCESSPAMNLTASPRRSHQQGVASCVSHPANVHFLTTGNRRLPHSRYRMFILSMTPEGVGRSARRATRARSTVRCAPLRVAVKRRSVIAPLDSGGRMTTGRSRDAAYSWRAGP